MPSWSGEQMAKLQRFVLLEDFRSSDGISSTAAEGYPKVWGEEDALRTLDKEPYSIAFTQDDSYLAVGTEKGIHMLSLPHLQEVRFMATIAPVTSMHSSPDGEKLIVGFGHAWRTPKGRAMPFSTAIFDLQSMLDGVELGLAPESTSIAASAMEVITSALEQAGWTTEEVAARSGEISEGLIDSLRQASQHLALERGTLVPGVPSEYHQHTFTSDGRQFLTLVDRNTTLIVDTISGQVVHRLQGHSDAIMTATFDASDTLVATASWDGTVGIWDILSGALLHRLGSEGENEPQLWAGQFSPDGKFFAVGAGSKHARVYDIKTEALVHSASGFKGWVRAVSWSADGKRLAFGSDNGSFKLLEAGTWAELQSWQGGDEGSLPFKQVGEVRDIAWSKDGSRVSFGLTDGQAIVYEERTNRAWNTSQGPPGESRVPGWGKTLFRVDGRLLVTSNSASKTLRVWTIDP